MLLTQRPSSDSGSGSGSISAGHTECRLAWQRTVFCNITNDLGRFGHQECCRNFLNKLAVLRHQCHLHLGKRETNCLERFFRASGNERQQQQEQASQPPRPLRPTPCIFPSTMRRRPQRSLCISCYYKGAGPETTHLTPKPSAVAPWGGISEYPSLHNSQASLEPNIAS